MLCADDRLAIADLLTRADNAATSRNPDDYVNLFTADGILDGAKGSHQGRDAIASATVEVWAAEGRSSTHLTLNLVIDPQRPDAAIATSTLLIVTPAATAVSPPQIQSITPITHHVVRVDGRWMIARRTVG